MNQLSQHHLPIGTVLQDGKYKILKVIGEGGFGITYLAHHKLYGEVALKELFLQSGSINCIRENASQQKVIADFGQEKFEKFKKRFEREITTLYNLRHVKGVVEVREFFEENGTVYFSMDYLTGDNLRVYTPKNGLSEQEGLKIIKSLSQTLSEVHKENVLHRDIKPSNIIIDEKGEVYLIDFGIARAYIEEIDTKHTIIHTPGFSPPEQSSAKDPMGKYSDVYALGATAYFIFTGKEAETPLERYANETYKEPKEWNSDLSDEINEAINKSLALKPQARTQTVEAFLAALTSVPSKTKNNRYFTGATNPEPPDAPTIPEEPVKEKSTWKKNLLLGGVVGTVLLGLLYLCQPPIKVSPLPLPPSLPIPRQIKLEIFDTSNQPIKDAAILINGTSEKDITDSVGTLSWDITNKWKDWQGKTLSVVKNGFFPEQVEIANFFRDTVINIQLISNKVPNSSLFCEHIVDKWTNENGKRLEFRDCDSIINNSPEGRLAFFNNEKGMWESFKKEDGHIYIDLTVSDSIISFLVKAPFNKDSMQLIEVSAEGQVDTFKRYVRPPVPPQQRIIRGRIIDNNGTAISGAFITIENNNSNSQSDASGKFSIDITDNWRAVRNKNIEISSDGFITETINISDIVNHKKYRSITLKRIPIEPSVPDSKPIKIDCKEFIAFWVHKEKLLHLKTCNGDEGEASFNGQTKSWTYAKKGERTYLTIIDGTNNLEFLVHNLTQEGNISLELIREGATQYPSGKGPTYSKSTKEEIFCENISRKWKRSRVFPLSNDELNIISCAEPQATYNGESVTWFWFKNNDGEITVNIRHEDRTTLSLRVNNPLSKKNISLEEMRDERARGRKFKPSQ